MSVVEDVRQALQDFLAPELRAFTARLDAMDSRSSANLDTIKSRFDAIDQRFADMTTVMNTRFDSLSKEIGQVREMLDIDRRLTRLESRQSTVAQ
jgi:uncharacterized coiled-coil protein SlyX